MFAVVLIIQCVVLGAAVATSALNNIFLAEPVHYFSFTSQSLLDEVGDGFLLHQLSKKGGADQGKDPMKHQCQRWFILLKAMVNPQLQA